MKTKAGAPAIVIAVVALVAFMSWWGYRSFNEDRPKTAHSAQVDDMLTAEAQKCQGDFSKLPPEDQDKVNKVTGGWGAMAIKKMYKQP